MPWKETLVPNERMKFIAQCDFEEESMAQLCRKYGISRKRGYKWLERWLAGGPGGLADRSRAPLHHPQQVPLRRVEAIAEVNYPAGWAVRKVQSRGEFYWRGEEVSLSAVLFGERIGLAPVGGRHWRTYFGPVWLGVFDSHCRRMLTPAQLRRQPELLPGPPQDRPSAALQDDPAEG